MSLMEIQNDQSCLVDCVSTGRCLLGLSFTGLTLGRKSDYRIADCWLIDLWIFSVPVAKINEDFLEIRYRRSIT